MISASSAGQPSLRGLHSEGSWQPQATSSPPARQSAASNSGCSMPAARASGGSRQVGSAPQARYPGRMAGGSGEPHSSSESVWEPEVPGPTSGRGNPGRSAPRTAAEAQRAAPSSSGIPLRGLAWEAFKGHREGRPPPPPARPWLGRGLQREGRRREAVQGREVLGRPRSRRWTGSSRAELGVCASAEVRGRKVSVGRGGPALFRSPAHRPGGSFAGTKRAPDMAFLE